MNKTKLSKNLDILHHDMMLQKKIYRPSAFWSNAINEFTKVLKKRGVKNFRREKLANMYFVPLYNHMMENNIRSLMKFYNNNKFSKKIKFFLNNSMSGFTEAFNDYKVFKACDDIKKKTFPT